MVRSHRAMWAHRCRIIAGGAGRPLVEDAGDAETAAERGHRRTTQSSARGRCLPASARRSASEAAPQTDEACGAHDDGRLSRTPVAAPRCGRIRVHSRCEASVAVGWPNGEPIDRSPEDERSTKRRRGIGRAHDAGARMHRPTLSQRLRAAASESGRRVVLLPSDTRPSGAVVGIDGADDTALRQQSGNATPNARGWT